MLVSLGSFRESERGQRVVALTLWRTARVGALAPQRVRGSSHPPSWRAAEGVVLAQIITEGTL